MPEKQSRETPGMFPVLSEAVTVPERSLRGPPQHGIQTSGEFKTESSHAGLPAKNLSIIPRTLHNKVQTHLPGIQGLG